METILDLGIKPILRCDCGLEGCMWLKARPDCPLLDCNTGKCKKCNESDGEYERNN